jgi:uncharacterized protein YacL
MRTKKWVVNTIAVIALLAFVVLVPLRVFGPRPEAIIWMAILSVLILAALTVVVVVERRAENAAIRRVMEQNARADEEEARRRTHPEQPRENPPMEWWM